MSSSESSTTTITAEPALAASSYRDFLLGALIVLAPCVPLFRLSDSFYSDWYNHTWQISYYAEHFRRFWSLPITLNTDVDAGMATPVFYGYAFYPLMGFLALFTGPGLAVRLVAALVFSLEYGLTLSTLRRLGASRGLAVTTGALVVWAIYPLTNLYNRAALTEFFAVGFLTCAVLTWFRYLVAESRREQLGLASAFALFYALAFGIHPITGMLGTLFLVLVVGSTMLLTRQWRRLTPIACFGGLALLVLLPWLVVTMALSSKLLISEAAGWVFYPDIDTLRVRFVPFDVRVGRMAFALISTPYLDATCNVALLGLFIAAIVRVAGSATEKVRNRVVIPVALVTLELFLFFLFLSLDSSLAGALPGFLNLTQFGYRVVTYQDLSLLGGLLFLLLWNRGKSLTVSRHVLIACLVLSGLYLTSKWTHAWAVHDAFGPNVAVAEPGKLPRTFNGFPDYQIRKLYEELGELDKPLTQVHFRESETGAPGEFEPETVTLARKGWVGTNIQQFAWTRFFVDNVPVSPLDLHSYGVEHPELADGLLHYKHVFVAVWVSPGTHIIQARVMAPAVWRISRTLAFFVLAAWICATVVALAWPHAGVAILRHSRAAKSRRPV